MKKLDIMNSRKDEQWEMVNGKVQRVIPEKVEGPIVSHGIKEIIISTDIKEKENKKSKKKILMKK